MCVCMYGGDLGRKEGREVEVEEKKGKKYSVVLEGTTVVSKFYLTSHLPSIPFLYWAAASVSLFIPSTDISLEFSWLLAQIKQNEKIIILVEKNIKISTDVISGTYVLQQPW